MMPRTKYRGPDGVANTFIWKHNSRIKIIDLHHEAKSIIVLWTKFKITIGPPASPTHESRNLRKSNFIFWYWTRSELILTSTVPSASTDLSPNSLLDFQLPLAHFHIYYGYLATIAREGIWYKTGVVLTGFSNSPRVFVAMAIYCLLHPLGPSQLKIENDNIFKYIPSEEKFLFTYPIPLLCR